MPSYRSVPLDRIREPATPLRTVVDDGRFQELCRSIQAIGLLQPIVIAPDGDAYRVVAGHRRYLAHRYIGRPEIECRLLDADEAAALEAATAENVARADLTPVEEAQAIRRMTEQHGRTVKDVAAALGHSEAWVRGRLELLTWPEPILEAVATGTVSVAVARELVLVEDERYRTLYLRCATESGSTASQMRMWRQEWEQQRAIGNDAPPLPPSDQLPPTAVLPHVSCAMCDALLPIIQMQLLKVCEPCVLQLRRAKWEAQHEPA